MKMNRKMFAHWRVCFGWLARYENAVWIAAWANCSLLISRTKPLNLKIKKHSKL